jgi:hypothetical protein
MSIIFACFFSFFQLKDAQRNTTPTVIGRLAIWNSQAKHQRIQKAEDNRGGLFSKHDADLSK